MAEKKKELHSFMISFDSETLVKYLAPDQKAQLLDALYDYAIRGNKRDFSGNPLLMASYEMMTKTIDENKQKYDDKCLKNSANQKLRHLYDDFQKSKDRGLPTIEIEQAIRSICDEYEISIRPDIFKQMGVSTNVDERIQKDTISTNVNTDRNRNTDIKGNVNTDRQLDTESYPDINQQTDRQTETKEIPVVENSSASVDSDGRTAWNEITSFLLECDLKIESYLVTTNINNIHNGISGINNLLAAGNTIEEIKEAARKYYAHYKRERYTEKEKWKYALCVHSLMSNKVGELKQYLAKDNTAEKHSNPFDTWLESIKNTEAWVFLDDINWRLNFDGNGIDKNQNNIDQLKSAYTGIEKLLSRFSKKTLKRAIEDFYEHDKNLVTLDVLVNDMDLLEPYLNSVPDPVNAEEDEELPFN